MEIKRKEQYFYPNMCHYPNQFHVDCNSILRICLLEHLLAGNNSLCLQNLDRYLTDVYLCTHRILAQIFLV